MKPTAAMILAGLLSAVVGGLVVGALSRSQTGITGPTAGLTVVVAVTLLVLGIRRSRATLHRHS